MKWLINILLYCFVIFVIGQCALGKSMYDKVPFVYHDKYDISFYGLERFHSSDAHRYSKAFDTVTQKLNINRGQCYTPEKISDDDLRLVHTQRYLDSFNRSKNIAYIADDEFLYYVLCLVPHKYLQQSLLEPMRYATGGTVMAAELALQYRWAINFSGGYHHAKSDEAVKASYCFFADIPLAIHKLWKNNPNLKVMIVDLDAHQGNGNASILKDDPRIAIFDLYNEQADPWENAVKKYIRYHHPVKDGIQDEQYLNILHKHLPAAIKEFEPDLIIYNAGTDPFEKDKWGKMKISSSGIIQRDNFVFSSALKKERPIPVAMVLSGSYSQEAADIIGTSIVNIVENVIKKNHIYKREKNLL